ncbi:gamma-secretase subunit PEN-2-like protein [Thamnocephalis sphaerospora]|uniref:Gamma-secretase subunit PEN-2-like protein n=1 Tax=Thamnocephalis sphaerospora TaxID=78915 RepID=A0A4P9XR87_9FUNG|nr:gamma-secretase subunit PEN-2-like protein [Thamnocephalis sphaerospora]|eukprot:RKP08021.1 gamma-secretase subunit PEN-2-like protein [Thamnocephalis sphaerospora]
MPKKLSRMSDAEIADVARKMFLGGLPFLPLCWIVASVWLFKAARERGPRVPQLRRYHTYCMVGAAIWFVISTAWFSIFVTQRLHWGAVGDKLTVVQVKGI